MSQEDRKEEGAAPQSETPAADLAEVAPANGTAAAAPSEIEQLHEELRAKAAEATGNYDLFLRERAELENFKKRMAREKADALRFASESLVRDLLPIVDNLERAVAHVEGNGEAVIEGVRLVLKALQDALERHGVRRIDAVGAPFDPARHQAMQQVESPDHEPNHVVDQYQSGYLLHDRLLRPALVSVNGRKSDAAVASDSNSG